MLDIIKELVPLLDGAKDGAIWLIAAYLVLLALKMAAYTGCFIFLVWAAKELITFGIRASTQNTVVRNINNVRFEHDGKEAELMVEQEALAQLMVELRRGGGMYIHNSDVIEAAAILRKARAK